MHHSVPDGDETDGVQAHARLVEHLERNAQRRLMVGDPVISGRFLLTDRQTRRRSVLADPFDDAVGQRIARIRVHQLEFHR